MKLCGLIFLVTFSAMSQPIGWGPNDLAFLRQPASTETSYIETNLSTAVTAWYFPGLSATKTLQTNGGTYVYLPDCYTNAWDVTNASAASTWPIRNPAGLNGFDTVSFNSKNLRSISYTNKTAGAHEVCMVLAFTNGVNKTLFDGHSATRNLSIINSGIKINAGSGVVAAAVDFVTNKWMVFNFVFNGVNSTVYTNNGTDRGVVNAGSLTCNGLVIGADNNFNFTSQEEVALMVGFAGVLSTTDRSNLVWTLRTRFNLSL